ncbi:hypothetical protein Dimus_038866 [Dionaea muscipula]
MCYRFLIGQAPIYLSRYPINATRVTSAQFSPLFDKLIGYINRWLGKTLSYAGRLELIKSVLQGINCFWLSFLPLPSCALDKINSYCRNFLFGEHRPPVAWKKVYSPKIEGGLGLH